MKVKDVIIQLNNGVAVTEIAQRLNVSKDTLNRRLKTIGYEWDNSAKKRIYIGSDNEPLELDMTEVIKGNKSSNNPAVSNMKKLDDIPEGNKKVIKRNPNFTQEEIKLLKEWANQWKVKKNYTAFQNTKTPQTLPHLGKKIRKTFHIAEDYIEQIDAYAKNHHLNKSDVLHLALHSFFKNNA